MAASLTLAAVASFAAEMPFSKPAFDKALAEGKPVVVDFAASWCPTCKQQKPIVQSLANDVKRKSLTIFVADFDKEEALKKQLNVTMQSTLVAFKSGKEVARSTGQTDKAELAALLDKAL
ncbi:MAG: thioredoxin family protein [Burkholderiales bacterium]